MSITVTNEMLKAVHEYNMGEMGEGSEMTDSRLIERIIELHESSKPKPEPLSEREIKLYIASNGSEELTDDDAITVVRLSEKAHGIGD